jgi:23S rRNA pseudouridine2605 synthase
MPPPVATRTGLARALSKLGFCSRSRASELIRMGKVKVNRTVRKNPEYPVILGQDVIIMDDVSVNQAERTLRHAQQAARPCHQRLRRART